MKFAYLIMGGFSPKEDSAAFPGGDVRMVGVSSLEEACDAAAGLAAWGVDCIELCGAFGEEGARAVIAATQGKVPVGYVVHLPEQDGLFQALFG